MAGRGHRQRGGGAIRNALERGRPSKFQAWTLVSWHRADLGITLNAGNVSAQSDQWSGAHHATQGTAGKQPLWVTAGTVNGRPSIRYDGVDDMLVTGAFVTNQPIHALSMFKMVAIQSPASNHDIVWSMNGAGTAALYNDTTPRTVLNFGSGMTYAGNVANGAFARVEVQANGVVSNITENDTQRTSGNAGAGVGGNLSFGDYSTGGHATNVEFVEHIVFGSILPASPLSRIRNYQKAWSAIT